MKITHHAYKRFSERTTYTPRQKNHNANQAYRYGRKISEFTGAFYEYLLNKQLGGDRTTIKILDTNIYVFDNRNKRLITVYPVPNEYLPIKQYLGVDASPCVIKNGERYVTEGNSDEPIIFKTVQAANNYIKNTRELLDSDNCMVVILGRG